MNFPVYLWIGSWRLHPHIVFEALAYTVTFRLILWKSRRDTIAATQRTAVIVGGLLGALIGAKVLVLLQHLDFIWQGWQPFLLLLIQGKTIVGGILGALIGVEITKKLIGVSRSTGDLFVYPLIVGTAIGRIGCFLTGLSDQTYGVATTLPWGVDFGDGIPRHPTQLYEIGFLMGLMVFLKTRSRYPLQEGELFQVYLIAYLGFRLMIDFIKPEFRPIIGLSAIQIACILGLVYYRRNIPNFFKFITSPHP